VKEGKPQANMVWLWGVGRKPSLPSFKERFGVSGSIVSAVDLVKGIGALIGLDVLNVEGATGYLDTNYGGKVKVALSSLEKHDFVYLHVEAPDEASHEGSLEKKIQAIEDFDSKVVGPVIEGLDEPFHLAVLTDHRTPVSVRTHTAEPVPFAIWRSDEEGDNAKTFSEKGAESGSYGLQKGLEFIELLFSPKS
ncbi:phosphoglycerate mutase, partial [Candidatus Altiarchaeota archaeon]